jgi:hypothetical protein
MFIGLTTCPKHASGNVGDQLITDAAINLIDNICGTIDVNTHFRHEDFTSRLDYLNSAKGIILFGFPILPSDVRPTYYRIAEDLDDVEPPILPIGAAYNFYPGDKRGLKNQYFEESTKSFLNEIVDNCPNGKFPVRTEWVGKILQQNGYQTELIGDPAWYDPKKLGEEFHRPKRIEQLVFTTPHRKIYLDQAQRMLDKLTAKFPDAERIVSLHSVPNAIDRRLWERAKKDGWKLQYASHDTSNLEFYRDSDLHVGYRKHGHLAHLRWRRPSVVLAEDSRAQGLNETFGTGGFAAFKQRPVSGFGNIGSHIYNTRVVKAAYLASQSLGIEYRLPERKSLASPADPNVVEKAIRFIDEQQSNGWMAFDRIQEVIDDTYQNGMEPLLKAMFEPHL